VIALAADLSRSLSPRRKLGLSLEIMAVYAHVRWLLRRSDLPETLRVLRTVDTAPPSWDDRGVVELAGLRLGRAVGRTLDALPVDSRCLTRSLILVRLLARRGIESSLVIGVSAEPEFGAHAWVEAGERALLPRNGSTFERLVRL
jgi:hypothetical protein